MELISRRGALQAIARLMSDYDCDYNRVLEKCRDAVKKLPTHGEKRKTGKWVRQTDDYHDYYECENCGIAVGLDDVKNYCPKCGLRMVLDENDEKNKVCEERKQNCYECPYEDDCVEYRW